MKKVIGLGKYFFVIFLFSCALFCACIGIYALQKSMTIKMNFNVLPNIRCELYVIPDGGNEKLIFSNYQNLYIDPDWTINEGTSTLSYLHNLESNLGNHYTIKVLNYTPTKVFAEVSGTGASYSSVALDAFSTTPDNLDNVLTISAVSSNYEITFYKVENYFLTANLSGVQFDLTNYEDNTLLKCGNNYYIPLGEDLNGKLVSSAGATILFDSISTVNYTYTNNILTISNANLTNTTLTARGVYYITTTFTNVSIDTSYESNTVQIVESSPFIFADTNLQAKLNCSMGYTPTITSLICGTNDLTSAINSYFNEQIINVPLNLINGNISITANRVANNYTVTFDANGGSVSPSTTTVTYGSTYGTLPTPTGATFKGWNGKNLFDINYSGIFFLNAAVTYNSSTGIITSDATGRTNWWEYGECLFNSINIPLVNGKSYTLSIWMKRDPGGFDGFQILGGYLGANYGVCYYKESGTIPTNEWKRFSTTIVGTGAAITQVGVYRAMDGPNPIKWYYKDIMVEENSTATAYEPYYITSQTQVVRTTNHTLRAIWA